MESENSNNNVKFVEPNYKLVHVDYPIDASLNEYINKELARKIENGEPCSGDELASLIKAHHEITRLERTSKEIEFGFSPALILITLSVVLLLLVLILTL
ncbi:hypothetical protein ACWEWU_13975 [Staphylococcus xylosus]